MRCQGDNVIANSFLDIFLKWLMESFLSFATTVKQANSCGKLCLKRAETVIGEASESVDRGKEVRETGERVYGNKRRGRERVVEEERARQAQWNGWWISRDDLSREISPLALAVGSSRDVGPEMMDRFASRSHSSPPSISHPFTLL